MFLGQTRSLELGSTHNKKETNEEEAHGDTDPPRRPLQNDHFHLKTRSLWLGNLPSQITGAILRSRFSQFGEIESTSPTESKHAISGQGYINFFTVESAIEAFRTFHNQDAFRSFSKIELVFVRSNPIDQSYRSPASNAALFTRGSDRLSATQELWPNGKPPTGPRALDPVSPPQLRRPTLDAELHGGRYDSGRRRRTGDIELEARGRRGVDSYRPGHRRTFSDESLDERGRARFPFDRHSSPIVYEDDDDNSLRKPRWSDAPERPTHPGYARYDERSPVPVHSPVRSLQRKKQKALAIAAQIAPTKPAYNGVREPQSLDQNPAKAVEGHHDQAAGDTRHLVSNTNVAPSFEKVPPSTLFDASAVRPSPASPPRSPSSQSSEGEQAPMQLLSALSPGQRTQQHPQEASEAILTEVSPPDGLPSRLLGPVARPEFLSRNRSHIRLNQTHGDETSSNVSDTTCSDRTGTSRTTSSSREAKKCSECRRPGPGLFELFNCSTPNCRVRLHMSCGGSIGFVCGRCAEEEAAEAAGPSQKEMFQLENEGIESPEVVEGQELGVAISELEGAPPASITLRERTSFNDRRSPARTNTIATVAQKTSRSLLRRSLDGAGEDVSEQRYQEMAVSRPSLETVKHSLTRARKQKSIQYTPKMLTCPHWKSCRHGEACYYSHIDTRLYFPTGRDPAKHFTCFHWLRGRKCQYEEDDCLYTHDDTGLYVRADGLASERHITCFWYHTQGHCNKSDQDCRFAHRDTGTYAHNPAGARKAITCSDWKATGRCRYPEAICIYSHPETSKSVSGADGRDQTQSALTQQSSQPRTLQRQNGGLGTSSNVVDPKIASTPDQDGSRSHPRNISTPDHGRLAVPVQAPVRAKPPKEVDSAGRRGVNEEKEQQIKPIDHARRTTSDPRLRKTAAPLTPLVTDVVSPQDPVLVGLANELTASVVDRQSSTGSAVTEAEVPRSRIRLCAVCGKKMMFATFSTCKECLSKANSDEQQYRLDPPILEETRNHGSGRDLIDEEEGASSATAPVVDISNEMSWNDVPSAAGAVNKQLATLPSKWDNAYKRPAEGGDMFIPSKKTKFFHVSPSEVPPFSYYGSPLAGTDQQSRLSGLSRVASASILRKETLENLTEQERLRKETMALERRADSDRTSPERAEMQSPHPAGEYGLHEHDLSDLFEDSQDTNSTEKPETVMTNLPDDSTAAPQMTAPLDTGNRDHCLWPESHESSPSLDASTPMDISIEQSPSSRSSVHHEVSPVPIEVHEPTLVHQPLVIPKASLVTPKRPAVATACSDCRKRHRKCRHREVGEVDERPEDRDDSDAPLFSFRPSQVRISSSSKQQPDRLDEENQVSIQPMAGLETDRQKGRSTKCCDDCRRRKIRCTHDIVDAADDDRASQTINTLGVLPKTGARQQAQPVDQAPETQQKGKPLVLKIGALRQKEPIHIDRRTGLSRHNVQKPSDNINTPSIDRGALSHVRDRSPMDNSPISDGVPVDHARATDFRKVGPVKGRLSRTKFLPTPQPDTPRDSMEAASNHVTPAPDPPRPRTQRQPSHRTSHVVKSKHHLAVIERMKASGVEFDSDEDSDTTSNHSDTAPPPPSRIVRDPLRARSQVSRDLFEIAPQFRTENLLFDLDAKKREITARPDRKENLRRRRNNGTGALLLMSDWKSRRKHLKDIHHEVDRALPSRMVLTTREKTPANPVLAAFPAIDEDRETEQKEVTFEEFMDIPAMPKFTLVGANQQLAFRDGMNLKQRVPDGEKLPVGSKSG